MATFPSGFWRVQLFFRDSASGLGWSENYWNSGNSDAAGAVSLGRQLAQARATFLGNHCYLLWFRVEQINNPRQFIAQPPISTGALRGGYVVSLPAPTDVRINVNLRGSGFGAVNRVFMSGLSQSDIIGEQFAPPSNWSSSFGAFQAYLRDANQGYKTLNRLSQTGANVHDITSIAAITPRGNSIVTDSTATLAVGNVVRINAPPTQLLGIQGYKVVERIVSATTFTVGGAGVVGGLVTGAQATWTLSNFTAASISQVTIEGITNRRAGRPFGQAVGRRPNRVPLRR